jgi:HPt (histidine-containing phosphotransfer) domain-containing protein
MYSAMTDQLPDLNEGVFDQLARAVPTPAFHAVLESYAQGLPTHLRHLQAAADASDFPALAREAHDLKGFWGTVGADRLADLAVRLNFASETQDAFAIASLVPAIIDASAVAWNAIAVRLDEARGPGVGCNPRVQA